MTSNVETKSAGFLPQPVRPWLSWRGKRFWALVLLLIYTLAGFFLTPWLIERQLRKTIEQTGRSLSVTEIRTNPYLLTAEVTGLEIRDKDSKPLFTLDRFFADVQTSSVFHLALTFKNLAIERPELFDEMFQGTDTRLVRFARDLAGEAPPETDAQDSKPPPVYLQQLSVQDAYLHVLNTSLDNYEATAGPVTVNLADIRTRPDHVGSQAVNLLINETDRVRWQGDLQLVPFQSRGTVQFDASTLPEIRRLLDYFLPFDLEFDSIAATFDYRMAVTEQGFNATVEGLAGEALGFAAVMDDGGEPVVELPLLRFSGGSIQVPQQSASLERLELGGLKVRAALEEDGSISLLDMIPGDSEKHPGDFVGTGASAGKPWTVSLDEFELREGELILADRTVNPPLEVTVSPANLTASGINNSDGTRIPFVAGAKLSSGGSLGFDGEFMVLPQLELTGNVQLDDVQTALVQPYVNRFVNAGLSGGALTLSAEVSHNPEQLLAAEGTLRYAAFEVQDRLREEKLAAWDSLQVDRFELNMADKTLATSEFKFGGLYGRVAIAEDLSTNVGDLLVTPPENANGRTDDGPGTGAMPDFTVTIGGIVMQGTALDFSDRSLPLPFDAAIRDMDGTISTLSNRSEEPAEIALEGRVNEYGLARINGTTRPLDPTNQTDITMVFRNLDISRLTPYTIQFAGYAIDTGRLDLDLGYRLANRKLQGDNKVVIREMKLGEKSDLPGAGSLPLGLAVALLTDSDGVIDLAVPVEGDLDNPEFRIGGVIWRAIGNLITKVVTAPFRFLGSLVGIDSEDFGTLHFQPGRSDLSPPDREQLVKLGEAMRQRPELSLEISGSYSAALDRPALQAARIEQDISAWLDSNAGNNNELTLNRDRQAMEALLLAADPGINLESLQAPHLGAPADTPDAEPALDEVAYVADLRRQLEAQVIISESELQTLARARGQAAAAALQQGQAEASEALRVVEIEPAGVEAGDDSTVPLELAVSAGD